MDSTLSYRPMTVGWGYFLSSLPPLPGPAVLLNTLLLIISSLCGKGIMP